MGFEQAARQIDLAGLKRDPPPNEAKLRIVPPIEPVQQGQCLPDRLLRW